MDFIPLYFQVSKIKTFKVYKHQDHPKNLGPGTKDIQKYGRYKRSRPKDEMRWHDKKYPSVTRTSAGSGDAKLRHRHATLVPRPPSPIEDPLGLPRHPGLRKGSIRSPLHTME